MVSSPYKSGSVTEATTTPWCTRGDKRAKCPFMAVIGGEMGKAAEGASKRWDSTGPVTLKSPMATSTSSWRKVSANGIEQPEQDRWGAPFRLDPGAGLVHTHVLARDLQPLLGRGDRRL